MSPLPSTLIPPVSQVPPLPDNIPLSPALRWKPSPKMVETLPLEHQVTVMPPSPNEIISDEDQMHLMDLQDKITRCFFGIGDIANHYIEQAPLLFKDTLVTHDMIYAAVGCFCHRTKRTIRYYAETAAFFSPAVRQEFRDVPFSHFVVARSYGDGWRDVLEYARDNPSYSRETLLYQFNRDRLHDNLDEDGCDPNLPAHPSTPALDVQANASQPAAKRSGGMVLAMLSSLIDGIGKLAEDLDLSQDVRVELQGVLRVRGAMQEQSPDVVLPKINYPVLVWI